MQDDPRQLHQYVAQLGWLPPVLIAVCAIAAAALVGFGAPRVRMVAAAAAVVALLLAPSVWALDTLGHAVNGTFPEGGPANVQTARGGGMFSGLAGRPAGRGFGGVRAGAAIGPGSASGTSTSGATAVPLFGAGVQGTGQAGGAPSGSGSLPGAGTWAPPATGAASGTTGTAPGFAGGLSGGGRAGFGGGSPLGNDAATTEALVYVKAHGGGTIAVSSQPSAATAIIFERRKGRGVRRLLRPRERRQRRMAGAGGPLGVNSLGARRTTNAGRRNGSAGRYARWLETGDGGGRQGLPEGDAPDEQWRDEHAELGDDKNEQEQPGNDPL